MSPRKVAVLAGVLAGLCALAWLTSRDSDRVEGSQPLISVKEGEVSRLLRDRGEEHLLLEKAGGLWRLASPASDLADAEAVADVVQGLLALTLGSEVSSETGTYAAYSLTESSATRVRVYTAAGAAPVFDAYFGKEALGYASMYVRLAREKPVYLASGMGAFRLNRPVDDFREKSALNLEKAILQTVSVAANGRSLRFSKSGAAWISSAGSVKAEAIESFVSKVSALKAASFAAPGEKGRGFEKPYLTVEAAGTLKKARLEVGAPRPEGLKGPAVYRYARAEGRDSVFLVSTGEIDGLLDLLGLGTRRK